MPFAPNRSPSAYRVMIEEPDGQTIEHGVYRRLGWAHVVARRVLDRMPESAAMVSVESMLPRERAGAFKEA
jgi:hypothetical protein